MSGIQPSEKVIERIMDMTKETKAKKGFRLAPLLAAVVVLAIIVTGVFGGTAMSARIKPIEGTNLTTSTKNFFTITAYAQDDTGKKKMIDLKDDEIIKTDVKLQFDWENPAKTGSDCAVHIKSDNGFVVKGQNIKRIIYSSKNGTFSYSSVAAEESFDVQGDFGEFEGAYIPTASKLTITPKTSNTDEFLEIYYNPEHAADILLNTKDDDYTKLPGDTIIVKVEYKDGTFGEQTIKTSFDKNGYVLMEYVK